MRAMGAWIAEHQTAIALGLAYAYSSVVQTMPAPLPTERWYGWLYNLAHVLGANWGLVGQKRQA